LMMRTSVHPRGLGLMRRPSRWLIATVGASLAFAVLPAAVLAGPAPTIESESVSHVSPTNATLEAQIDVESLEHGAYYQFQVVKNTSEYLPELACPEPSVQLDGHDGCGIPGPGGGHPTPGALPIGFIPSNTMEPAKSASVSLDLAAGGGMTLQPGTTYHYRVLAVKRVQSEDTVDWVGPPVAGPDQTFTTPSSTAPVIDSVSVSHLTPTDATLEAKIDTEGLASTYEFLMWWTPCAICEDIAIFKIDLPSGLLLGSFEDQSVSLDLNSAGVTLQKGAGYGYSVVATSKGGSTEAQWQTFEPPPGVLDPLGPTASPGPVSNEPEVPLTGGQHSTSGGNSSPAPAGGSTSAAISSKPAHGKPSTKHGKRRKHKHHGKQTGKGHKRKQH
jgi:hypothetical protein